MGLEATVERRVGMSQDMHALAKALFPKPNDIVTEGLGGVIPATTVEATAMSDSDSGVVYVDFGGPTYGETGQSVAIPTSAVISTGQRVLVTVQDGVPVDCSVLGWGDAVREDVDNVVAHFWHDDEGAHITETENDATIGNNILIDTDSVDIRDGEDLLASFDADEIRLGVNSAFSSVSMCDDAVKVTANTTPLGDIYGQIMGLDGLELMTGDNSSRPHASVSLNNSPAWVQISAEDSGYSHQSVLMMEETNFSLSQTDGTNTVIRHLGFCVDHGNISSQSGGAQAQFATNGYSAMLTVGNDTTPSGQWGSKTLCTIPAGYRPALTSYYPVAKTGSPQSMSYVMIDASTGVVTLQNWGGTQSSVNYFCTCTWCY